MVGLAKNQELDAEDITDGDVLADVNRARSDDRSSGSSHPELRPTVHFSSPNDRFITT